MSKPQNFANHARLVPAFHFFVLPALSGNLVWAVVQGVHLGLTARLTSWIIFGLAFQVIVALALVVLALLARLFALGVQDRVIRLEERLRYQQLLPGDLKPRIGEFTINQCVALRFASDAELPTLARKVLDAKIEQRKTVKQLIQNWRADYQRI